MGKEREPIFELVSVEQARFVKEELANLLQPSKTRRTEVGSRRNGRARHAALPEESAHM